MSLIKGFHKHHIIPRYMGGSDKPENLVLLHPIDHAIAHLVRYRMFGDVRDLWAHNWLLGIKEPEVYTAVGKQREIAIKAKRLADPVFDKLIKKVRSEATKNRQEGYQKKAGEEFKKRFSSDSKYAEKIRKNRKLANKKSLVVRRGASAQKAEQVRKMRAQGASYKEIQEATGYALGSISNIVNNKMMANCKESQNA